MRAAMQSAYDRASILMDKGLYAHALPLLKQAIEEEPERAHAHALLGQCLQELNQMPEALKAGREALALDPEDAWVRVCLARTLAITKQRREATQHAEEAHRLSPEAPDPLRVLAHLAQRGGRHERALEFLDQALALAPGDPELHAMRAMSLRALGRHHSADEASREAMTWNPEEARALMSRGLVCLDQGNVREAEALFQTAVTQHPDEPIYRQALLIARLSGRPVLGPVFRRLLRVRNILGARLMVGLFVALGVLAALRGFIPESHGPLSLGAAGVLGLYAALLVLPEVLMASAAWLFREQHLDGVESASVALAAANQARLVLVGALFWAMGPRVLWALPLYLAPFVMRLKPRSEHSLRVTPRQRVTHQWLFLAASLVFTLHLALGLPHLWLSLLLMLSFFFTRP
ncbi:tetratricopeptide repeat protein [Archangium violaceum]|nr:tetratricopeptide repeat protein [Archangium violaceum]